MADDDPQRDAHGHHDAGRRGPATAVGPAVPRARAAAGAGDDAGASAGPHVGAEDAPEPPVSVPLPTRSAVAAGTGDGGAGTMAAAGIGAFDWDLTTGRLVWDDRMAEMFGFGPGEFDGTVRAFGARLHPDDRERVAEAVQVAIDRCEEFEVELRVLDPDGTTRWVEARGRALPGAGSTTAHVIGAAYDTTALREGAARVDRVLETMPTAFYSLDTRWRFTRVNAEAERVLGMRRDQLLGRSLWEVFPEIAGTVVERRYRKAVASGRATTFEHSPGSTGRWFEMRAWPGPDGLSVYLHDVTDRRGNQEGARRAMERAQLRARVASELAESLDAEETVTLLAQLVVPTLAQWCIVTLVDDQTDGRAALRDVGWWHDDPAMRPLVAEYARHRLGSLDESSFVGRALVAEAPVVRHGGATSAIANFLPPGPVRELLEQLAPDDVIVLPLRAHGRTLGLLTLYDQDAAGAPASAVDQTHRLEAAIDVANRAGLALDNARLYAIQRRVAEELQRSLLGDPPRSDDMQIAVRYQPAAEAARVGGDWYDAFCLDGVTTVVIGDVVGHDIAAAAAMGQVRALLRGIAVTTGSGPAEVLSRLDGVLGVLEVKLVATAVVATLERLPAGPAGGPGDLRVLWSSAGHPPPVCVHADGTVVDLGEAGGMRPDLLLGFDRTAVRHQHEVLLPPGATLLMFTDGLVERRREAYSAGLGRLRDALAALADRDLDEMCDELLRRLLPERPGDDVALAAVRNAAPRPSQDEP